MEETGYLNKLNNILKSRWFTSIYISCKKKLCNIVQCKHTFTIIMSPDSFFHNVISTFYLHLLIVINNFF